jgi:predicted nucleotide-binding protein
MANPRNSEDGPGRSALHRPKADLSKLLVDQANEGFALIRRRINSDSQLDTLWNAYADWSDFNEELLRTSYVSKAPLKGYRSLIPEEMPGHFLLDTGVENLRSQIAEETAYLEKMETQLRLLPDSTGAVTPTPPSGPHPTIVGKRVFLVHGHDDGARETVARYLERHLGLDVVILHEQPNQSRTLIEKLETFSTVDYAIVLMTPDDTAMGRNGVLEARARQNVILELGFFCGKLGRGRVCLLYAEGVTPPSDYDGIAYTKLDIGGGWKLGLAKELKSAGIPIDTSRLVA